MVRQWISEALAAQTISGTVKSIIRCSESNVAADFRSQLSIRVVSGDGGTVRGTLLALDESTLSNEWATSLTNRKFPLNWSGAGVTLSSVTVQNGDRIVVEVGYRAHNTSATSYTGNVEAGDSAAQDCVENETDVLQYNPWIEFSQNLLFAATTTKRSPDFEVSDNATITPVAYFYKMRARDSLADPPGYVTWIASGSPDYAGAGYYGGTPTPVGPMIAGSLYIADEWEG
jgi:hypothetical protein